MPEAQALVFLSDRQEGVSNVLKRKKGHSHLYV